MGPQAKLDGVTDRDPETVLENRLAVVIGCCLANRRSNIWFFFFFFFFWRVVCTSGKWSVLSEGRGVDGSVCRDISGFSDGSGEDEPGATSVSSTQTCLSF